MVMMTSLRQRGKIIENFLLLQFFNQKYICLQNENLSRDPNVERKMDLPYLDGFLLFYFVTGGFVWESDQLALPFEPYALHCR